MQETQQSTTAPETIEAAPEKKIPVIEVFGPVIQGEGSQAGVQTMFIRFGGCDFRCRMCDSLHAVMPAAVQKHATYMTTSEIRDKLLEAKASTGVRWVTFSGGNPCMHKLEGLVNELRHCGFAINVETQGTIIPGWLPMVDVVTVSPKGPGMGEKFPEQMFRHFLGMLGPKPLCVKVVVFSAADLEFALHVKSIVEEMTFHWPPGAVAYYLSLGNPFPPVLNMENDLEDNPQLRGRDASPRELLRRGLLDDYRIMSEEILPDSRLKDFRFLPQLHVLVYGNESER